MSTKTGQLQVLGAVDGKRTLGSTKQTSPVGIADEIAELGHLSAAEASARFETFLDALVADPGDFSLLGIGQRAAKLMGVSYKTLLQKVRDVGDALKR